MTKLATPLRVYGGKRRSAAKAASEFPCHGFRLEPFMDIQSQSVMLAMRALRILEEKSNLHEATEHID